MLKQPLTGLRVLQKYVILEEWGRGGGGRASGGDGSAICRADSNSVSRDLSDDQSGRGKQASDGSRVLEQACCPACV